jgi:DUF3072 family protein
VRRGACASRGAQRPDRRGVRRPGGSAPGPATICGVSASDPAQPNPEKDPEDWVTGEEPATGPQLSYLGTLAQQTGEDVPEDLTKAQASKLIDELRTRTGSGGETNAG